MSFRASDDPITGLDAEDGDGPPLSDCLPDRIPDPPDVSVTPGDLEKLSVLYDGPLASEYKARPIDLANDVVLAVRTYPPTGADPERILDQCVRWVAISDHGHIHSPVDRGTDPLPWLALEYLDGGTLRHRIGRVTGGRMLWIAIATLRAFSFAHARGAFHHTLTPESIQFRGTIHRMWDIPQVSDWERLALEAARKPQPDPRYTAPEQVAPDEYGAPDAVTDVYRLGAVTYELVTGRPIVDRDAGSAAIFEADPVPPSDLDMTIPTGLDEVLIRAVRAEKTLRYESVDDFRQAIEGFVSSFAGDDVLAAMLAVETGEGAGLLRKRLTDRERMALRVIRAAGGVASPQEFTHTVGMAATESTIEFGTLEYRTEATAVLDALVSKGMLTRHRSDRVYYALPDRGEASTAGGGHGRP